MTVHADAESKSNFVLIDKTTLSQIGYCKVCKSDMCILYTGRVLHYNDILGVYLRYGKKKKGKSK